MATQTITSAQVPDDPDILTTQDVDASLPSSEDNPTAKKLYPRLQYRPPALGVNPAYDIALDLIQEDRKAKLQNSYTALRKLTAIQAGETTAKSKLQVRELGIYIRQLQELAELNSPEVHWRHSKGDTDLSLPVYRRLAQKSWASKALLLVKQRVEQMTVTPDVIPLISPVVDVRMTFPAQRFKPPKKEFEAGQYMISGETAELPVIEVQSFDETEKTYTLAIVDPDVPDELNDSYTSYLHYLKTDVKLSAVNHEVEKDNGKTVLDYIPPHPQKGTRYHRYTLIVWEQPEVAPQPNAPLAGKHEISRAGFDAQHFAAQNGLHAVGINFWRQVWDSNVAQVIAKHPDVKYTEKNFKRIKA